MKNRANICMLCREEIPYNSMVLNFQVYDIGDHHSWSGSASICQECHDQMHIDVKGCEPTPAILH